MFKYLEKLRSKPEGERRKAIFFISLGVTLAIAVIWGIGLFLKLGSTDFSFKADKEGVPKQPSITETFSSFVSQLGDILNMSTSIENTATDSPATAE